MDTKVKVVPKAGDEPAPVELIEQAILDLAKGMKVLTSTRLKTETIVTLLHESSKVGKPQVRAILQSLSSLEHQFLKPKPLSK